MKRLLLRAVLFIGSFYLITVPFFRSLPCEEQWKGKSFNQLSTSEKIEYDKCQEQVRNQMDFIRQLGLYAFFASTLVAAFGPKVISVLFRKSKN